MIIGMDGAMPAPVSIHALPETGKGEQKAAST
jgi:hypothetical protein